MLFKRSFNIFSNNLSLVFKVLIYAFVLLLICASVLVAISQPAFNRFVTEFEVLEQLQEALRGWLDGDNESFGAFVQGLGNYFDAHTRDLVRLVGFFGLLYFLVVFFMHLTYIPIATVLHNKMSQNYEARFYHTLVASFGKALVYALINSIITVILDFVILFAGYWVFRLLYGAFGFLAFTIAGFFLLLAYAARLSLFGQWVPLIVCEGQKPIPAFRNALNPSFKAFRKTVVAMFLLVVVFFSVIMTTALITFFILPIVVVPAYVILMNSIWLTSYYVENKKPFYEKDLLELDRD